MVHIKRILIYFSFVIYTGIAHSQKLMGFTDSSAIKQADLEKQFDAQLNPQNLDTWMKFLSSHPHHVGSPQDKTNAEYIANLFRQWGFQTEINTYYVLFPTPKFRLLEITGAKPFKAKLEEQTLAEDHTSGQKSDARRRRGQFI